MYSQSQILLAEKKLKATSAVMKGFLKADTVMDSKKKLQQYKEISEKLSTSAAFEIGTGGYCTTVVTVGNSFMTSTSGFQ